jgi:septum formation protein
LLAEAGYEFEVCPPGDAVEGNIAPGDNAAELATRMALAKATDVGRRRESGLIVGCDTVVECDGRILGKPADLDDARKMLKALRGRTHFVYSGLCLWQLPGGSPVVRVAVTQLRMDTVPHEDLEAYLASGNWRGKAGAFGYQDRTGWIHVIEGSESNVVGLPLELLAEMVAALPPPSIRQ